MAEDDVVAWLLDQDPALRWRVERDLTGEPDAVWRATRQRVDTEGMGARLLAAQGPDGMWAGGAYFPKNWEGSSDAPGQPWTATTWSLNTLRDWGVSAAALGDTGDRLDRNARWEYDGLPYWGGEVDVCINAFTLANGDWLGRDMTALRDWFVEHEMAEGGWNCEWPEGATRASFHSTLNALIGLLDDEIRTGGSDEARAARHRGEEYLLKRRLLNRLSTGEQVGPWATVFAFPYRYVYSAIRATNYFLDAATRDGTAPDERLRDAIEVVRAARTPGGVWVQEHRHPGAVWFELDVEPGQPSPWLTYDGLRVLRWWDARQPA